MYSLYISIFKLQGNLFYPIALQAKYEYYPLVLQAKYEYYMENRHTYRRLRNKIGQSPNNRSTHSVQQSSRKGEPNKLSTETSNNMDTNKPRSQNKAKLAGGETDCCGGENPNTGIGICKTKQAKKTNKSSLITRKFTSKKIKPGANACECDEVRANLAAMTDNSDITLFRKETLYETTCYTNMKGSLAADDVTKDVERMYNKCVKSIVFEEAKNSIETEISSMSSANSRESGEVFLSEGIVSWKR